MVAGSGLESRFPRRYPDGRQTNQERISLTDAASIGGALGATKAAFDLAKTFVDIRDAAKLQTVRLELLNLLVEAQEAQSALIAEKRQLEERVHQLEAWDGEKERYQLQDMGNGCVAYALKPESAGADPAHSLCANCYSQGRKSILVPFYISMGSASALQCHVCGSEMVIKGVDGREAGRIAMKMTPTKATFGRGARI
jgi:hypothetical protein